MKTENIVQSPYAEWLERIIRDIVEIQPNSIGVVMIGEEDNYTAYYNADNTDMAVMAHEINADAIWNIVKANAKKIVLLAEQDDENEEDPEIE